MKPDRTRERISRHSRRRIRGPGQQRWVVPYADLLTLLFAAFAAAYAGSLIRNDAVEAATPIVEPAIASPVEVAVAPEPTSAPAAAADAQAVARERLQRRLDEELARMGLGNDDLGFRTWNHELSLSLEETVLFESGSADLRRAAAPTLIAIGTVLAENGADIRIEGHTDSQPIAGARFASNWELSTARATSLLRYLVEELDLPPARLSAVGYGPHRPVASNATATGRARNRRVEIVLVGTPEGRNAWRQP